MEAIDVQDLDFGYGDKLILNNVNFKMDRGSRCLLVGANGAGKSTLLKILAGKTLTKAKVSVLGKNAFNEGSVGVTYLGVEWAHNPVVKRDVPVSRLLMSLGAQRHKERCERLLDIMDVNPNWHMHQVSDGQRRRVQIILGLLEPWDVLLLDEVTVDLDVLARADLLKFLKEETESRNATIIYATHIFDGITGWASHIAHMVDGKLDFVRDVKNDFPELDAIKNSQNQIINHEKMHNSYLLLIVEEWLRKDYEIMRRKDKVAEVGKTKWDILSENMALYGDKYYNYWR